MQTEYRWVVSAWVNTGCGWGEEPVDDIIRSEFAEQAMRRFIQTYDDGITELRGIQVRLHPEDAKEMLAELLRKRETEA